MRVHILLSTYNGERFLAEQVESIQKQTYQDWKLLIRDDGSSDGTRNLIARLEEEDSRIIWIDKDSRENLGVIKSFHRLVHYQEADVYLFSDQDDVWLPDKVATQLAATKQYPADQPLLVYMDVAVVDEDLQVINESMVKSQSHHANTRLEHILIENTATGGVSLINHALARIWQETEQVIMHDWYLAILAASLGHLVYINQPGELYRQHTNNVIGAKTQRQRFQILRQGPRPIYERYWQHIKAIQAQAKQALTYHGKTMSLEKRTILENFITIDQQPFVERLRRLWVYGYRKNKLGHYLVFLNLMLTKIYHPKGCQEKI